MFYSFSYSHFFFFSSPLYLNSVNKKIVLYCIVLYCIVLYCIVLYCIVLYCIVLYCIVLYCIVLYCIVLYCIVLHHNLSQFLSLYSQLPPPSLQFPCYSPPVQPISCLWSHPLSIPAPNTISPSTYPFFRSCLPLLCQFHPFCLPVQLLFCLWSHPLSIPAPTTISPSTDPFIFSVTLPLLSQFPLSSLPVLSPSSPTYTVYEYLPVFTQALSFFQFSSLSLLVFIPISSMFLSPFSPNLNYV